jgi:uncharacterized lipoprotein
MVEKMKNSVLGILVVVIVLSACAYNPEVYKEQRMQEHKDHLKQNGGH